MRRAHPAVAGVFVAALLVAILLTGPLLLFNPWSVDALQERHGVPALIGLDEPTVDAATGAYLSDIWLGGEFAWSAGDGRPLLDERERSHMRDVSRLVRLLAGIAVVACVGTALTARLLRHEPRRLGTLMLVSAASLGSAGLLAGLAMTVAFEPIFLAFHALFFPPGTYLFDADSNLIRLFPGGFWLDASLLAGTTVVLGALAAGAIGWSLRRRSPAA